MCRCASRNRQDNKEINTMRHIRIRRFINYKNLCLFVSQLAHDYDRLGYEAFMQKSYKCSGLYARYLAGYREYLTNKESNSTSPLVEFGGKFILEPRLYADYFKFKEEDALDNIKVVPELYNHGFIFTSVQESVQSFVKGDTSYEKGF